MYKASLVTPYSTTFLYFLSFKRCVATRGICGSNLFPALKLLRFVAKSTSQFYYKRSYKTYLALNVYSLQNVYNNYNIM